MSVPSVDELLASLDLTEKVSLLSGQDVWRTKGIERIGVPPIKVSDGPNGVRGDSTTGATAVCLPASIGFGATFDPDLVTEIGRLLGRETRRKGAHVLLAPTVNLARHPLGGRNFESFGEEPHLTTELAVAYVRGVQDEPGVGACVKHFVANDVEYRRLTVSSEVDERTLREVYLRPFEAAVEAGVWTVMAAYPKLNGTHCTEHHWLLTDLLREEWGFDGLVMSDWGATHHPTRPIEAGMDLEMPGPPLVLGEALVAAVRAGEIDESVVDARARTVLDLAIRAGRIGELEASPETSVDDPDERAFVRRATARTMVLLRNESVDGAPVLPIADGRSVALIGPNADPGVIQGGGSAELPPHHLVTPLGGLEARFGDVRRAVGCVRDRYLPRVPTSAWVGDDRPIRLDTHAGDGSEAPVSTRSVRSIGTLISGGLDGLPDPMRWTMRYRGRLRIDRAGRHRFGAFAVGACRVTIDDTVVVDNPDDGRPGDGFFQKSTPEVVGEIELRAGEVDVLVEWIRGDDEQLGGLRFGWQPPIDEDAMLDDAVAAAEAADVAVVVVGLDADWETESHDRPMFGLPGRQDELVRRVAAANPNTVVVVNAGGPVDLPWLDEVPATLLVWYPGQEFGAALADVLSGDEEPGGRLPVTFPYRIADAPTALDVPGDDDLLHYREGVFVGHRWYDARGIEPRLPFGHGLSYADLSIEAASVGSAESGGGGPIVGVAVSNRSDRPGRIVVQAYAEPPDDATARPHRILCGFRSVEVAAGASVEVPVDVDERALRVWRPGHGWSIPSGTYRIRVGTSSRDLSASVDVDL